ncbi:MAG: DUF349 domain-containing protein [Balneolaceae bacterium]|nr:MAG: DUF349 domain-containing protein [Balneolaceae bacterium]
MTDSTSTPSADNKYLFENDYSYVTSKGEVKLKKTKLFEERTLTTTEADSVDAQIEAFTKAFENLEAKVDRFFEGIEQRYAEDAAAVEENFTELMKELTQADAIGDFEALVNRAKSDFEEIKKSPVQEDKPEKEKTVSETVEPVKEVPVAEAGQPVKEEAVEKAAEEVPGEEKVAEKSEDPEPDKKDPVAEEDPDEEKVAEESEDPKPDKKEPVAEAESGEEVSGAENGEEISEEAVKDDESTKYYQELADKAEELMKMSDWAYVSMEFDNIDLQWEEGPDPGEIDIRSLKDKIDSLRDEFEQKKKDHYEEQKRIRLENLEKKKDFLRQLKEIIDEKKWTRTKDVARIKGRWEHIKPIPSEEVEKLQTQFDSLITTFDEHKVDRLVKQKQQEEDNLTGKLVILEKMEGFSENLEEKSDWKDLEKNFEDLNKQFRKIGRVPSEKNQEIWDRYHKAQDTFHSMRFKHDKKYRNDIERFLSQKKKLIDEAEALIDSDDLADAARKVNKLHRRWKKVGNLPQKDENEMWDRFKAATDAFNDKKSENLDVLREQEDENYNEKLKLIDKANELKDSEDWEKTHKEFQNLMNTWKNIGPVPKRLSGKIWKKFKGAMDHFYDKRRDHFKEVKEERKDNLKEKEEALEKLAELKSHEDPIKAVELAKPLQDEFKKAGYVPIKHKNRMWKEYRETCDVIYDRFRAAKAAVEVVGRQNLGQFSSEDISDIRSKQNELNKLKKTVNKLSSELIQMKESLSYFKPAGKTSSLLDDVKKRIETAENDLENKEKRLADLEREIDTIRNES